MAEQTTRELAALGAIEPVVPEPQGSELDDLARWARNISADLSTELSELHRSCALMFGGELTSDALFTWTEEHEFESYVDFQEIASPATPDSDHVRVYGVDSGGTSALAFKKDDGVEVIITGGGGGGIIAPADPTASVGLTVVNGVASTYMRSDGAPPLDQGIEPTWTSPHIWEPDGYTDVPTIIRGAPVNLPSISGMEAWYKADSLSLSDTDPVDSWADSSGNGHDLTVQPAQTSPTYYTGQINSLPAVDFSDGDGSSCWLKMASAVSLTANTGFAVFVVYSHRNDTAKIPYFLGSDAGDQRMYAIGQNGSTYQSLVKFDTGANLNIGEDSLADDNSYHTYMVSRTDAGDFTATLDLADVTLAGPPSATAAVTLNAVNEQGVANEIRIAEMLIYDQELSSADIAVIEDYLDVKYNIAGGGSTVPDLTQWQTNTGSILSRVSGRGALGLGVDPDTFAQEPIFHVREADASVSNVVSEGNIAVFEGGSTSGISLLGGASGSGSVRINFGNTDDNDAGRILYNFANDTLNFWSTGTQTLTVGQAFVNIKGDDGAGRKSNLRFNALSTTDPAYVADLATIYTKSDGGTGTVLYAALSDGVSANDIVPLTPGGYGGYQIHSYDTPSGYQSILNFQHGLSAVDDTVDRIDVGIDPRTGYDVAVDQGAQWTFGSPLGGTGTGNISLHGVSKDVHQYFLNATTSGTDSWRFHSYTDAGEVPGLFPNRSAFWFSVLGGYQDVETDHAFIVDDGVPNMLMRLDRLGVLYTARDDAPNLYEVPGIGKGELITAVADSGVPWTFQDYLEIVEDSLGAAFINFVDDLANDGYLAFSANHFTFSEKLTVLSGVYGTDETDGGGQPAFDFKVWKTRSTDDVWHLQNDNDSKYFQAIGAGGEWGIGFSASASLYKVGVGLTINADDLASNFGHLSLAPFEGAAGTGPVDASIGLGHYYCDKANTNRGGLYEYVEDTSDGGTQEGWFKLLHLSTETGITAGDLGTPYVLGTVYNEVSTVTGANWQVELPEARKGEWCFVANTAGGHPLTVVPASGDNIDGGSADVLDENVALFIAVNNNDWREFPDAGAGGRGPATDVVQDGDFGSDGLLTRNGGAGSYAVVAAPSGTVVGTSDTQTLTAKDLTAETNKLRHSKSITVEDPADGDRLALFMNERAITILGVSFASLAGTSVLFNLEFAASIASGTVIHTDTCASATPEWDVTPSGDATVPTDQIILLEITTVTGSVTDFHVTVYYDED